MPHTYAAALMATDCSPSLTEELRFPWPTFEIVVPSGLIVIPEFGEAESVYLSFLEEALEVRPPIPTHGLCVTFSSGRSITIAYGSLSELINDSIVDRDDKTDLEAARAVTLLRRLALNVILDITSTPSRAGGSSGVLKRNKRGEPQITTHVIGRPLDLDCRQDIRDYVAGTRSSEPKCTTLVRGHWRNQVHGPGNALRKLLWIQPFYRGHGPMLVRPTRLGFRHDEEIA